MDEPALLHRDDRELPAPPAPSLNLGDPPAVWRFAHTSKRIGRSAWRQRRRPRRWPRSRACESPDCAPCIAVSVVSAHIAPHRSAMRSTSRASQPGLLTQRLDVAHRQGPRTNAPIPIARKGSVRSSFAPLGNSLETNCSLRLCANRVKDQLARLQGKLQERTLRESVEHRGRSDAPACIAAPRGRWSS